MEPTLVPGDVMWIDKTAFGPSLPIINKKLLTWGSPKRGEVITFVPPHKDQLFVKRVIAVPGDHLRIEGMKLWVNGQPLAQQITREEADYLLGEGTIAASHGERSEGW